MSNNPESREVLTLEEVAAYLRLPKDTVSRQAAQGNIPGRQIEETWRFLKAAIDDWLRSLDARTLLLQQAGALAQDESLSALRDEIYAARGRREVAASQDS
jgi:excisionase family DNA binding protein